MKRIANLVVLTLALNFVLAAGGVGWLAKTGHLTKPRMAEVRRVLFPPPATQPAPTTRPAAAPPTDAQARLAMLAARAAGRRSTDDDATGPAAVQQVADLSAADVDVRRRQLDDMQAQVVLAQQQVARDREQITRDRAAFAAERDRAAAAAADKGFQDSLQMYASLPAKQVKAIFATLPDDAVQRYLQAMEPRQAAKVMKEFKSPTDAERLKRVLEGVRQPRAAPAATTQPSTPDAAATAAGG